MSTFGFFFEKIQGFSNIFFALFPALFPKTENSPGPIPFRGIGEGVPSFTAYFQERNLLNESGESFAIPSINDKKHHEFGAANKSSLE